MSPTRREFIVSTAVTSVALALPAATVAQAAALPPPTEVVTVVLDHTYGLPPTTKLTDLRCAECGDAIAPAVMDELDKPAWVICQDCYDDKVGELEEQIEPETTDWDKDELEEKVGNFEDRMDDIDQAVQRLDARAFAMQDAVRSLGPGAYPPSTFFQTHYERIREELDDLMDLMRKPV